MYKKILIISVALCCSKISLSQTKENFDWLLGKWKLATAKGYIVEEWKKQNDSLYNGYSAFVSAKDSVVEETIEIRKQNGNWVFVPTTANQNDKKPVVFNIIFIKNKELVCENLKHDFPARINYRLYKNNLLASIEGKQNGKFKKVNYDYERD